MLQLVAATYKVFSQRGTRGACSAPFTQMAEKRDGKGLQSGTCEDALAARERAHCLLRLALPDVHHPVHAPLLIRQHAPATHISVEKGLQMPTCEHADCSKAAIWWDLSWRET
jgi:hypothetical protein